MKELRHIPPHQNGKAERTWRSLFEMSRCILFQASLPKPLWTYAVLASAYIRNRCFNKNIECTPFQNLTGRKPNIANMRAFGSDCYAKVQNPKKLDDRSEKGIFVGYDRGSPSYLVYFPETQTVRKVRCVKFLPSDQAYDNETSKEMEGPGLVMLEEIPSENEQGKISTDRGNNEPHDLFQNDNVRPKRNVTKPKYLEDYYTDSDNFLGCTIDYCYVCVDVPKCYEEAITHEHSNEWKKAMDDEMFALGENNTYELVPLPPDRKAIQGRWEYAEKSMP